ncbi:MAG: glycosyltransferase family 2 protein [Lachnospiraceae bacterium]|nr:glycosyltransferase family 2 protein [Lachnospiraceae bacterium]
MKIISIIVPAYNEEKSVLELYKDIIKSCELLESNKRISNWELWFINDGSTDRTEKMILELMKLDNRVHIISFRKNFGKAAALQAGFRHVKGDLIFTMDADLQDDPAEFVRFIEKIDEGYDLVVGWKQKRLDPMEKRLPSKLFNTVTSKMAGFKLHDFDCGFKCFRREVVESLDLYGELHRYIPVLAYRNGFRITEIPVHHRERKHGRSKYGIERYMRGLLDSLTTTFLLRYSDRPMYFFGRIGVLMAVVGFLICMILTIEWLCGQAIGHRPLLILGVLLIIVGFQSISTGFVCNLIIDKTYRSSYREDHIKMIQ